MIYALLLNGREDLSAQFSSDDRTTRKPNTHEHALSAMLLTTTTLLTLRGPAYAQAIDGPVAFGKEELLAIHLIDAEGLDVAIEAGREMAGRHSDATACEIRVIFELSGGLATPK